MSEIFCPGDLVQVFNGDSECGGLIGKVSSNQDTKGKIKVDFDEKSQGYFDATELCRVSKEEDKEDVATMFHRGDLVSVINKYYGKIGVVISDGGDGLVSVDFRDGSGPEAFHPDKLQRLGAASDDTNSSKEFMGLKGGDSVQLTVPGEKYYDMVGVVESVKDDLAYVRYPDGNKELFAQVQLRKCNADDTEQEATMQHFSTGAVRDVQDNKPRPDLVSPFFILRLGEHLRKGAEHYGDHNWEKGIPNSRCFASLMRHLNQWASGETNEDHLAAAAFNLMVIIHNEEVDKKNAALELQHKDLLVDMPNYFQFTKEEE